MAYRKLETPYTIPFEVAIQIYLDAMEPLTSIFLRILPVVNINTLEKVFSESITFTKQADPNGRGLMLPT